MILSVVTVNRNNASGLRATLESTLGAQPGFGDWEQIVVDGASTDGGFAEVDRYRGDPRLGWCVSEPDTGIYNAMNKGAAHARGDYLLFLNSGDTLEPDVLAKVFAEPIDADIAYGDLTILRKTGPVVKRYPAPEEIRDWHFLHESLPHPASFISRGLFERIGGYDESFRIVSDAKFFLRAVLLGARLARLPLAISRFGADGISLDPSRAKEHRAERRAFLSEVFGDRLAEIVTRSKPKPKPKPPRTAFLRRWRLPLAALAAAILLPVFFLAPTARHAASSVPSSITAADSSPLAMAPGDHLQLLYHFNLLGDYISGTPPWFRDLWQFNVSDEARPRNPDFCYAPAALPFLALRSVGLPEALAWNLDHLAFLVLGFLLCFAFARRIGASPEAALLASAMAACLPYRYATIATGSPTGFGMGIVPAVFLGADMAVRDRSPAGGLLCGAAILLLYATDLHCFLFAAGAAPLWCAFAAAFLPPRARRPEGRARRLAVALLPIAATLAVLAFLGAAARAAYRGTNVAEGRTLAEVALHSPAWRDVFRVDPGAPLAGQIKTGLLPALILLAAAVRFVHGLASAWRRRDRRAALLAAGGLVLAAAIVASYGLSVGTNGPCGGFPLRLLRTIAPPFRLVRQPIKVLCLLPSLFTALAAIALSPPRARGGSGPVASRTASRPGPAARALLGALAVAAVAADARSGLRIGLCRLAGPNAAYEAAAHAARARGEAPRAIVLPITRGDAPIAAAYLYWAQKSRLRMLDGYAAVRSNDYERDVYWRFLTMEDGDLTADQLQGLRSFGVNAVLVHEDALARVRPAFTGGTTLRWMLASPHLRFLRSEHGVLAFELLPDGEASDGAPFQPTVESARFHKSFAKRRRKASAGAESSAEVHSGRCGWLVRAESGDGLELESVRHDAEGRPLVSSGSFPAGRDPAPGAMRLVFLPEPVPAREAGRGVRLLCHGPAKVSDAMFATESATGAVRRICFADLPHRWGETFFGADGQPAGIRLVPGWAPACCAVSGPFLPLAPDGRRIRLSAFDASRILPDGTDLGPPESLAVVRPDRTRVELKVGDLLPGDGTEPVSFDVSFDPAEGAILELRSLSFEDALQ